MQQMDGPWVLVSKCRSGCFSLYRRSMRRDASRRNIKKPDIPAAPSNWKSNLWKRKLIIFVDL